MTFKSSDVLALFSDLRDPLIGESIAHKLKLEDIEITENQVRIRLNLAYFLPEKEKQLLQHHMSTVLQEKGLHLVALNIVNGVQKHKVQEGLKPIETIKNIIAVASGKGGVGKSTTAVNLAIALSQAGARVAILDADIYGPSQPLLLGLKGKPTLNEKQQMNPPFKHGVYLNSFGFLLEDDQAAIWRGPMVVQAMNQLLHLTAWEDIDYLIVDMPPGTGDIALSLAQKVPVVGAVIVTTPQDVALLDVRKGLRMFQTVNVPILGIVENMSVHICSKCGHEEHIFGQEGGKRLAEQLGVDYLGALPLDRQLREQSDLGEPIVAKDPDGKVARIYHQIARKLMLNVSNLPKDWLHKLPPVVVKR